MNKHLTLALALVMSLMTPPVTYGGDVDELKTIFEQGVAALNKRDLKAWISLMDDGIVFFSPNLPLPVVGKEVNLRVWQNVFEENMSITFTPIKPEFHVTGSTGVVWGYYVLVAQPSDVAVNAVVGRYTVTYTKLGGKWRAVVIHNSLLPQTD